MHLRFVLLLIFATRALPCSCGGTWPSVKQAWERAPFVFSGTVEVADPDEDPRQTIFQEQSVRIRVDEAFKGVSAGQKIELDEGANDCAGKFRTGQRAVFYLYQGDTPETYNDPPCTYTLGNAAPGGDDLLFLRGLPKSAKGTRLSGEVELYEDSAKEAFRRVGGVPNVSVRISGPGGLTYEKKTNADGAYEIYGLSPGRYSVNIAVPAGLRIAFPVITGSSPSGNDNTVELRKNDGVSIGFVLKADTRLSGRLLDSDGNPITGVCIDLEPIEGRGENGARFFNCSKAGGFFQMEMMPSGKYWLVARDEIKVDQTKSQSTLYYPGVRDREEAKIISIEAGKFVEHLNLTLPANEKRYEITGRMQFEDGVPAPGAGVTFQSPQHGYTETTQTSADGSFSMRLVAGMQGQLEGGIAVLTQILASCPELKVAPRIRGIFRSIDAKPVSISSDSDQQNLKLILPSPSCKTWPSVR